MESTFRRGVAALRTGRSGLDKAVVAAAARSTRRLWPALPYTLRIDHPPTAELKPRYGYDRPRHGGVESLFLRALDRYETHLKSFEPNFEDLARIPLHGQESLEPCWHSPWLIGMDIVTLYSFVRNRRPRRFVEVGSGQSTKVVARARRDASLDMEITSIDPQPRSEVDALCDRLVRIPLEKADLGECFGSLTDGDIVFFDGSHRVLPNSDCVAFFLDVLPSLPAGVMVAIHDIWLPDDYPDWSLEFWWSEQYLLAAMLLGQPSWLSIELPTHFCSSRTDLDALVGPLFDRPELSSVDRRGSVCWLEMTGN